MTEGEVDSAATAVLDFWFELSTQRQFAKDDALDAEIATRFGALHDHVAATHAAGWRDDRRHVLAAVILLDQFSRNLFRGQAAAFAADGLARDLTDHAIDNGWDRDLAKRERVFLYMPLMHAEDAATQARSVAAFEALGIAENIDFARDHADVITRFGRFPSRNVALGRDTTAEEQVYLEAGGGW